MWLPQAILTLSQSADPEDVVLDSLTKQVGDACKALASLSTKAVPRKNRAQASRGRTFAS